MSENGFSYRLSQVPQKPGVYVMKDSRQGVLYVGKAASLRNRLRSYFGAPYRLPEKIKRMLSRVADFEYILTESESEALILECNFIKEYRPPYNARLKDDKNYPYIKIDLKEDFPQLYITRRVHPDGARYFGPFASAGSVRKTLDLLKKLFPYRSCTKVITGTDPRPCLEYYIHRCVAPCIGAVTKEEYHKVVQQVIMFLEGHADQVLRDLETKMQEASDRLEFERAAVLRDQVKAIEQVMESRQIRVSSVKGGDMDVIALAPNSDEALVEVFFVRNGKLMGRDHFVMEGVEETDPSHLMAEFIKQFYTSASYIPQRILLQHPPEERLLLETWLRDKRGATVKLVVPRAGEQRKLVKMVEENATEAVNQKRHKWLSDTSALTQAIEELQEALSLPRLPKRIECYDISNIQGTNPVASMVVFEDGTPKPAYYRRFRIKTVEGIDDFSMMQEVLRRRFKHLASERAKAVSPESLAATDKGSGEDGRGETWGIVPHLVLIDGGKGHLSSALEVFLELGIKDIPLASIAKENEWLFVPQTPEPIILPRTSQALYLVQRVRDEAHRFAITYHRNLRSKSATRSALDVIPGIGPKRKRMLLRRFVSLQGIKEAPVEALAAVPGMTIALAQRLKERL